MRDDDDVAGVGANTGRPDHLDDGIVAIGRRVIDGIADIEHRYDASANAGVITHSSAVTAEAVS
ncbi:hypothetical protein KX816_15990 [Sphingosinicellaceae bacterium]|nr:hypothetical protein KX816_15990 [Sphingosinicellaceae bacterium]